MPGFRRGGGIKRLIRLPLGMIGLEKADIPTDTAKPKPTISFHLPKPGIAVTRIGDNQWTHMGRQHLCQLRQEGVMTAWSIVVGKLENQNMDTLR